MRPWISEISCFETSYDRPLQRRDCALGWVGEAPCSAELTTDEALAVGKEFSLVDIDFSESFSSHSLESASSAKLLIVSNWELKELARLRRAFFPIVANSDELFSCSLGFSECTI